MAHSVGQIFIASTGKFRQPSTSPSAVLRELAGLGGRSLRKLTLEAGPDDCQGVMPEVAPTRGEQICHSRINLAMGQVSAGKGRPIIRSIGIVLPGSDVFPRKLVSRLDAINDSGSRYCVVKHKRAEGKEGSPEAMSEQIGECPNKKGGPVPCRR